MHIIYFSVLKEYSSRKPMHIAHTVGKLWLPFLHSRSVSTIHCLYGVHSVREILPLLFHHAVRRHCRHARGMRMISVDVHARTEARPTASAVLSKHSLESSPELCGHDVVYDGISRAVDVNEKAQEVYQVQVAFFSQCEVDGHGWEGDVQDEHPKRKKTDEEKADHSDEHHDDLSPVLLRLWPGRFGHLFAVHRLVHHLKTKWDTFKNLINFCFSLYLYIQAYNM